MQGWKEPKQEAYANLNKYINNKKSIPSRYIAKKHDFLSKTNVIIINTIIIP
jgi:hypothetical protein